MLKNIFTILRSIADVKSQRTINREKRKKQTMAQCVSCHTRGGLMECGKLGADIWYHKECYPKLVAERDKQ